jgi:hypothetical protein
MDDKFGGDIFEKLDQAADDTMDLLKDVIETIASDPLIALRFISGISLLAEGAYDDGPDRESAVDELIEGILEEMTDRWAKRETAARCDGG